MNITVLWFIVGFIFFLLEFIVPGFILFFFGLVPYLPSYGGYIRYTIGIIVSGGLGYYAIKTIGKYIEDKQAELQVSTEERSKKVHPAEEELNC